MKYKMFDENGIYQRLFISERSKIVDGFLSPEGGPDITDRELDILASTYASCRKTSDSKEKCSKIAWGAVNKYRQKNKS